VTFEVIPWGALYVAIEWTLRIAALVIVPRRRTTASARAWLLLILFEPLLGVIAYLLIGRAYLPRRRLAAGMIGLIAVIGVLLPTLGLSLLATLGIEAVIRRRYPATGRWLGLEPIRTTAPLRRS